MIESAVGRSLLTAAGETPRKPGMARGWFKKASRAFGELSGEGLLHNAAALFGLQFFRKILPVLTIPYLVRVLGPASWGLVAIFQSLSMVVMVVIEFGFPLSAIRTVARCRNCPERLAGVVAGIFGAQALLAAAAAATVVLASPFVPVLRNNPAFVAACILWSIADGMNPTWYFLGSERMRTLFVLEVTSKSVALLAIFALVHSPSHAWTVLALQAIGPLLSIAAGLGLIYRDIPFRMPSAALVGAALREGWSIFVIKGCESLCALGNTFLLGLFVSPAMVGFFAGPEKIGRGLTGFLNPIRDTLFPRISKLMETSPRQAARFAWVGTAVSAAGGLALGVIVFVAAPPVVRVVLGAQFEPAVAVLRMFAIIQPIVSVSQAVQQHWLLPLGRERAVSRIIRWAALLNLVLILLLVPKHAYIGMAWAVVGVETFVCVCVAMAALTGNKPEMAADVSAETATA